MTEGDVSDTSGVAFEDLSHDEAATIRTWHTYYKLAGPEPIQGWDSLVDQLGGGITVDGDDKILPDGRAAVLGQNAAYSIQFTEWNGIHLTRDKDRESEYNKAWYRAHAKEVNARTKVRRMGKPDGIAAASRVERAAKIPKAGWIQHEVAFVVHALHSSTRLTKTISRTRRLDAKACQRILRRQYPNAEVLSIEGITVSTS